MKRILSVIFTIVLILAIFTGCTEATKTPLKTISPSDPTATPEASEDPYLPTPTPKVEVAEKYIPEFKDGDVIEFNIFNTSDYQSRWNQATREYLMKNYQLKVANEIPGIAGYENVEYIASGNYFDSEAKRLEYNAKIALLMQTDETTPDFWTSLYASSVANDAPWFDLAPYLVDLSPYLEEDGPLYEGYVNWVWEGNQDYWYKFKSYLETDDGELYVLPRREKLPVRMFTAWNQELLQQLGIAYEDRATDWSTLIDQLKAAKALSGTGIPFQTYGGSLNDVIAFVATTYGLDFKDDFSWETKNGEPLWTYVWDEYLDILTDVKTLAEEHLIYNDKSKKNLPLGYNLDSTDPAIEKVTGNINKWCSTAFNSGLFLYAREDKVVWVGYYGTGKGDKFKLSDTWVSQDGYDYSMFGTSEFDFDYYAISNGIDNARGDHEFTNRICKYMAEYMCNDKMFEYFWGQRGVPFAETVDEAGSWEYMEYEGQQLVWRTNNENGLSWTPASSEPGWNSWFWEGRDPNWYANEVDPHYEQYIAYILSKKNDLYKRTQLPKYGESNAELFGFTDGIGCYDNTENWRRGLYYFADNTAFPTRYMVAWRMDPRSKNVDAMEKVTADCNAHNGVVYTGFFRSTYYVLGNDGAAMTEKIQAIKKIAKNFTVDFLSGTKDATAWTQYIRSLKEAGYMDVYNYYNQALEVCSTEHIDTIKSQSNVNARFA